MGQPDSNVPLIQPIQPTDSLAELTSLLHRAYAPLAARGLHFLAANQDEARTGRRISRGECYLAI